MGLSIPLFRRRPVHPEIATPNEPTFNASLLVICILLLGVVGFIFINYIGFPADLGR